MQRSQPSPSGALDSLVAAVTAAANQDTSASSNDPSSSLDALFGTQSFSTAYQSAATQKPEEAISPLWARMLLNHFVQSLSNTLVDPNSSTPGINGNIQANGMTGTQSHNNLLDPALGLPPSGGSGIPSNTSTGNFGNTFKYGSNGSGSLLPPAVQPVQTTRSGRKSRPPVTANASILENLAKEAGMDKVLEALAAAGIEVPKSPPALSGSGGSSTGNTREKNKDKDKDRRNGFHTRQEVADSAARLASAVPKDLAGWQSRDILGSQLTVNHGDGRIWGTSGGSGPSDKSSRARVISNKYFSQHPNRPGYIDPNIQGDDETGGGGGENDQMRKRTRSVESSDGEDDEPLRKLSKEDYPEGVRMRAGKPVMSKEEARQRQRERNKKSAKLARERRKNRMGDMEERVNQSEACIKELEEHCEELEEEVERLQNIIRQAGLDPTMDMHNLPNLSLGIQNYNPATTTGMTPSINIAAPSPLPTLNIPTPTIPGLATLSAPTVGSTAFDSSPAFDLDHFDINAFFSFNDDEDDGEFIPQSSPKRDSDSEGEGDSDDDNTTPGINGKKRKKKGKGKKGKRKQRDDDEDDEEEEEEFEDEEVEDEDLFLPIEDVPYPPEAIVQDDEVHVHDLTGDMMKALKVDTRQQLAAVMQKLVDSAGEGGVTEDVVEKLKSVIHLAKLQ